MKINPACRAFRTLACALILVLAATALAAEPPDSQNPLGLDAFIVAMTDTVIEPENLVFDGNVMFEDILGMTPAEADAFEAEAVAYWDQRFGVDANDPRFVLTRQYANPELRYRVHHFAGRNVPPEGWRLDDGAVMLTVVDPAGITLGGEFAGVHVPAGTAFPYGFYLIHPEPPANGDPAPNGPQWEPLLIHFRGFEPVLPGPLGAATIRCQVFSEEFGTGLAQGIFVPRPLPDGNLQVTIRNVMTLRKD